MKHLTVIVLTWLLIMIASILNAQNPVLETYTYSFDFEGGSVGAWSSYPTAQDISYDPTIWVKNVSTFSNSLSLVREITPNYDIDYLYGFRKKVDLYVNPSSILSFKYFIKDRFIAKSIRVKFGFEDGTKIEKDIPHNNELNISSCKVNFSEYLADGKKKHLKAIAILVVCPKADAESLFRFAIDDVVVNGERAKNWVIELPETHKLDEWKDYISAKHYKKGEELIISGKVPFKATSATVFLSRVLTGEDGKTYTMNQTKEGKWEVKLPLEKAGFWRANMNASDQKGNTISSSLVCLVKPHSAPNGHPCLFISPKDEKKIISKMNSGHYKEEKEHIQNTAKSMRDKYNVDEFIYNLDAYDEIYWLPTYVKYSNTITAPTSYIKKNAVEYAFTKNEEAGDLSRKGLLKMAEWPSYVHPHILNQGQHTYWPVGLALIDLAVGYDFAHKSLSESDRKIIAEALYNKGVVPVYTEYVKDNRVSGNTSNWISHVNTGGLLCAMAIMNEYSDKQLEPYLSGLILKLGDYINMSFGKDGAYGEGYSYHDFSMLTLLEALPALDRNFGINFPQKINSSYKYLYYQMNMATGKLLDFGDTGVNFNDTATGRKFYSLNKYSYLLTKYQDPHLKWLYDLNPQQTEQNLYFPTENIIAEKPELQTIKRFRDVGTVIFRSGFDSSDFNFVFRCGPFYNHQHFDQGSFFLSDKNEEFITETGKTDYYNDPWYNKLFIQPGGHNCILVNGNSESQQPGDMKNDVKAWNDYAEIKDFIEFEEGAFVSGDLTKIYKKKYENLSRNILYIKPRTIVMIDRGIGANGAKEMNLRFHAPRKKDISIEGNTAKIDRSESTLFINTISQNKFRSEIIKRPLTLHEFKGENALTMTARGFLQLSTEANSFINVITTDKDIISNLETKNTENFTQFKINNIDYYVNNNEETNSIGKIKTDALIYSSNKDGYTALKVKEITEGTKRIFSSDSRISISVKEGKITTIKYSTSKNTIIRYYTNPISTKVELNNELISELKSENNSIILNIPEGEGVIKIFGN